MKILLVMASVMFMMGCEEMDGQLAVSKSFSVNVKNKPVTIEAGSYNASLDFKKDKVETTIKSADDSVKLKVVFAIPANSSIPANGNFELRSAQTGQPVDVLGTSKTVQKDSATQSGWEQCQVNDYQTICNPSGCSTVPVTRWGRQYTEYYVRTTNKDIQFSMTEVGSASKKLAQFQGASQTSQKIIIRQDRCF